MSKEIYTHLLQELDAGRKTALVTELHTANKHEASVIQKRLVLEADVCCGVHGTDRYLAQMALASGLPHVIRSDNHITLIEPCFPQARLVILGGGHIALPLVSFGTQLGFHVTVVDDRPEFAQAERFPEAQVVLCSDFAHCADKIALSPASFVVIVTRGHVQDLACLRAMLPYHLAYLGMIGSKRRVEGARELLQQEGFSAEQLRKVYAPIGLAIGAITPAEIALSILAQIVAVKRLGHATTNKRSPTLPWPEFDKPVLETLAHLDNPVVIATVLACQGSTPRKPGAKMLIWPDSRILGSIGGGLGEAQVISRAREVFRSGQFLIHPITMTAPVTCHDDMVCGGLMEVLLERGGGYR